MATLYAKAAGGNWSAAGTWSATGSAGVDNAGPPAATDDVILELGSGAITVDAASVAKTVSCSAGTGAYTGILTHNAFNLTVSGSVTLVAGMTYTPLATSTITINATATLTTGGKLLPLLAHTSGTLTLGDNLSFMASKVITFKLSGTALALNGRTVSGNSDVNRILIQSNVIGTAATITNTTGTFANADFQDITFSSAVDYSAITGLAGDCGGNTGSTLTTAVPQTHDGTTSNWSTAARWTSRVPLPQDNVSIPSGTGTVTVDMPRIGASVTFAGFTGTVTTAAGTITLYGSFTASSGMTLTFNGNNNFNGRGTHTITSAGKTGYGPIVINSGTYSLSDALLLSTNSAFTIANSATFNTNSFSISFGQGTVGANTTTNWGTSTVTMMLTAVSTLFGAGGTFSAASATFVVATASASARTFAGGGKTFGDLRLPGGGAGAFTITSANTFNRIYTDGAGVVAIVLPGSATTTLISGAGLNNGTNVVTFTASAGSATISKSTGILSWNYVSLTNIPSTGGATFYAGANSTDGGGNTGWIFATGPSLENSGAAGGNNLMMMGCG